MIGWKYSLIKALQRPLPGEKAHLMMAPSVRYTGSGTPDPASARDSSVLILLYPKQKRWTIPFIQRPDYKGVHGGQVSLPGGKYETSDTNSWETALRETREELGIKTDKIQFLGSLTNLYIPNSNFLVHPYIGYLPYRPNFHPCPYEVSEILEIPVPALFHGADHPKILEMNINNRKVVAPCFNWNGHTLWGATAMIMNELNIIFRENMPQWANSLHSYNDYTSPESL
ncbi:NUDIX hydrolase [Geofilum sp. OHC36d9]|uniref:NUDIX hydrolase n=1 Tax=Geofilum sp. OHC36d9 TaxID=3458413 RepID=UPI0040348E60